MCTVPFGVHTIRTNIVIDDELMAEVLQATGRKTKREAAEHGLRTLLQLSKQSDLPRLRGKVAWQGELDAIVSLSRNENDLDGAANEQDSRPDPIDATLLMRDPTLLMRSSLLESETWTLLARHRRQHAQTRWSFNSQE
jgi:Arc/MetJ family transcription regulator